MLAKPPLVAGAAVATAYRSRLLASHSRTVGCYPKARSHTQPVRANTYATKVCRRGTEIRTPLMEPLPRPIASDPAGGSSADASGGDPLGGCPAGSSRAQDRRASLPEELSVGRAGIGDSVGERQALAPWLQRSSAISSVPSSPSATRGQPPVAWPPGCCYAAAAAWDGRRCPAAQAVAADTVESAPRLNRWVPRTHLSPVSAGSLQTACPDADLAPPCRVVSRFRGYERDRFATPEAA
jgi:hypothetical protein